MVAWKGIIAMVALLFLSLAQRPAAVDVKFAHETAEGAEGYHMFVRFEVTQGTVEQPFTITLVPVPGTAGPADYKVTNTKIAEFIPGTIIKNSLRTEAWASYELSEDSLLEDNEVFTLTARVEGLGAASVTMVHPTQLTVTIRDSTVVMNFCEAKHTMRESDTTVPVCLCHESLPRSIDLINMVMVPKELYLPRYIPDLEGQYEPFTFLVTAGSNKTCQYLTYRRDDWTIECYDETYDMYLASAKPGIAFGDMRNMSVIVEDDDGVCVKFTESTVTVIESDGKVTLGLKASRGVTTPYTVNVIPSSGSALAPQDYNGASLSVEFSAGETEALVTIPIVNDNLAELQESFTVKLVPTSVAHTGQQNMTTVVINNDDANDLVWVKFEWPFYTVEEWWQSFWVKIEAVAFVSPDVYRPATYNFDFTVRVQTVDIVARAYIDYWPLDTTITFTANQNYAWVQVYLKDDSAFEVLELFGLQLSIPDSGQLVLSLPGVAFVTIKDNDAFSYFG